MLKSLLEKLPVPTILHRDNGEILLTNASFKKFFGVIANPESKNFFVLTADTRVQSTCEKAITTKGMQGIELPITLNDKSYLVQYLALPLKDNFIASLIINDTLRIESLIAHVRQLRKSAYDHTWIISNCPEPKIIWSNTPHGDAQNNLGMIVEQLVHPEDVSKITECLNKAQKNPGKLTSIAVRPIETPEQTIDLDVIFYPNLYFYGHFIASSHVRRPGSNVVIDRLKSAFMVESDTELAEALNVPPSAITRAKKQKMPPLAWLEKAFNSKGVSMDWLLGARTTKFID